MIRFLTPVSCALAMLIAAPALAQHSTGITYQGRLDFQSSPYTGTADYGFRLWSAETGGSVASALVLTNGVTVEEGLFQADLDFGSDALAGERWLAISVRTPSWDGVGAEPPFTALPGRQRVSASPYALHTRGITVNNAGTRVGIGTTAPLTALHVAPREGILLGESSISGGHTALRVDLSEPSGGFARLQAVRAAGSEWGNLVLNQSGGNVGIGVSAPARKLDVAGTGRFSSELTVGGGLLFPGNGRIRDVFTFQSAVNFGPIPPGGTAAGINISVPGALPGDFVIVTLTPHAPALEIYDAFVSSEGMVQYQVRNTSNSTFDPPAQVTRIMVMRP